MTKKRRNFDKGIKLRPDTTAVTEEGEVKYDDTAKKIQYQDDSATRSVVSEDGTQTLQNKTIDATSATGNNTLSADSADITYDNATSGMTATDVQAAIDEIDTRLEGQDEASEISYDNTTSGLTATNVQTAIDEVEGRVDTIEGATYVNEFNGRTGNVTPAASDYDADQVDYDNASSGLTATDTQAAIDEVEGRLDTAETGLSDHLADAVDAHDASAISYDNASSGLTATEVQAAIDEIDTTVDSHVGASSGVHGVTGDVVGTTDTQTLTNKTISGASIQTPTRSDVKQDTLANLQTFAATASNGQLVFATDTKQMFQIVDNALVSVGGGGSSLDIFHQETFETTQASDFTTGNSATFLDGGAGALVGTLSDETGGNVIEGSSTLRYFGGAIGGNANQNDWIASPVIDLDEKQQGQDVGITLYADLPNFTGSFANFIVYDVTNSEVLTSSLDRVEFNGASGSQRYSFAVTIPSSCTQIRWGIQDLTGFDNMNVYLDSVEFSLNPFQFADIVNITDWESFTPTGSYTTNVTYTGYKRRIGDSFQYTVKMAFTGATDAGNISIDIPDGTIDINKLSADIDNHNMGQGTLHDTSQPKRYALRARYNNNSSIVLTYFDDDSVYEEFQDLQNTSIVTLASGDEIFVEFSVPIENLSASSEHVITPAKSTLTDWESYTPTFGGFGTVTGIDVYYKQVGDSYHIQGTFVTGTTVASTASVSLPNSAVANGASGQQVPIGSFYRSVSASNNGGTMLTASDTNTDIFFSTVSVYDSSAVNPLTSANGDAVAGTGERVAFHAIVPIAGLTGEAQFLAAVPVQKTVFIKDVKTSTNSAGSSSANTVQTRDLGTITGDSSFVTVSSNQFTLPMGQYLIQASAPAFKTGEHQAFLYNVSDTSYDIDGTSENSEPTDDTQTRSLIDDTITITGSKTFEIRHWTSAARATDGLGKSADVDASNPQSGEVYTVVKITKLR